MKINKAIVIQTIFISLFMLILLFETYLLTTQTFNPYIVPFKRTFKSEFTSLIGNISILSIICLFIFIFIRRPYRRIYTLGICEIVLSVIVYALMVYSRYYFTFFSFRQMSLTKNPAGELGVNVAKQVFVELFTSGMFLILIPGVIFIVIALICRKKEIFNAKRESHTTSKKVASSILAISLSFAMTLSFRLSIKKNWPYNSDLALYGCQNTGVYNYYLYEVCGWNFYYSGNKYKDDEVTVKVNKFNRNDSNYINFLDEENSDSRVYMGSLSGKNLKIIQLESLNTYCIDLEYDGVKLMPNLNKIIDDNNSYYLSNFYTSAGQGKTADAEIAINTGVNPQGQNTQHWDFKVSKKNGANYDFQTLADMFKEKYNSTCYSFHGDLEEFYNRQLVHTVMFGYDEFYSLEEYVNTHKSEDEDPTSYINGWVDDKVVIEWEKEVTKSLTAPFMSYQIMTVSHTPFVGNPKEEEYNTFGYKNKMLYRYLAYMKYVDDYLGDLYEVMKNDPNTVYVLYGDHGSYLTKKEQKELFKKQSTLEFELNNTRVPGIIFDGSGTLNTLTGGNMVNNKLRSQIDLFTTIVDLFDLDYKGVRLGVNALSNESTFTYDPNTFTIITDNYIYYAKNDKYDLFNPISIDLMKEQVKIIKEYKLIVDIANRKSLLYKEE